MRSSKTLLKKGMSNVAFRRAVKSVRASPKFNDEEEMALMRKYHKEKE
jgi:hypothetical protein